MRLGITKYNCYTNSTEHTFNGSVRATDGPSLDLPTYIQPELFTLTAHSNLARLLDDPRPRILLVDQVAGDLSISGALACEADFVSMVVEARRNHPNARLLLRTHPDTRFSKKAAC